jgi:5'-3' exonuclease
MLFIFIGEERGDLLYKILAVDYSNLLYRSYWSAKGSEVPGLAIQRFAQSLHAAMREYRCNTFVLCGESFTILHRTKFDKSYKSGRTHPQDEDFGVFNNVLKHMLKTLGVPITFYPGYEGDDVIATLCANNPTNQLFIMSMDKDLRQLLSHEHVFIVTPDWHKGLYNEESFYLDHGFLPDRYKYYKALVGDTSDSVKGVDGIGPVNAKKILTNENWETLIHSMGLTEQAQFNHALRMVVLEPTVPDKAFDSYLNGRCCTIRQFRSAKRLFTKVYGEKLVEGTINEFKKLFGVETMRPKIIAVEFDGVLVIDCWPNIGDINTDVIDAIRHERKRGTRFVLQISRTGEELEAAINFCMTNGLEFDGINENMHIDKSHLHNYGRVYADEYWDERKIFERYLERRQSA